MPAQHDVYIRRNERIGQRVVYICRPRMARLRIGFGMIPDGTMATITDAFDFDYPFMYTLDDGRKTRGGGLGWIGPNGEFSGSVIVRSMEEYTAARAAEAAPFFAKEDACPA